MTTKEVLDHHLAAFGAGDALDILKDYDDDSLLILPDRTVRGRDDLRAAFEGFFSGLFAPGTYEFTLDREEVAGEIAYIAWHARCASADVPMGSDTFLVRDGRIAVQTFAALIQPR